MNTDTLLTFEVSRFLLIPVVILIAPAAMASTLCLLALGYLVGTALTVNGAMESVT
jgi:cobyrinic acid a,c-diamide synthase